MTRQVEFHFFRLWTEAEAVGDLLFLSLVSCSSQLVMIVFYLDGPVFLHSLFFILIHTTSIMYFLQCRIRRKPFCQIKEWKLSSLTVE
jgi:cellulose synthase/poly-beta-1,6-N-acetylglucosamine synthase-like glycosyltransferase